MDFLALVGVMIIVFGRIGFLIAAFRESILWGLGCILLSPVSLVFLFLHWPEAKNPFFLQLVGLGLVFLAASSGAELNI